MVMVTILRGLISSDAKTSKMSTLPDNVTYVQRFRLFGGRMRVTKYSNLPLIRGFIGWILFLIPAASVVVP
jgi:hypothetical protein